MTGPFTITFARGFGTGGKEIASRVARELGIHCYENRILHFRVDRLPQREKRVPWTIIKHRNL